MAPPPRPPDPLFPPPPPPHDLPSRFPQQARPSASYPCLPSSSSANRGKTPGRQTNLPPKLPPRGPLGHPLRLLQGGPRRPGGAEPGGGGGLPWIPAAARTRCQEAQERDGAGGVAEPMDGPLAEGALAVGVHGTPLFSHPRGWGQGAHEGIGALDVPLVDPGKVQVGQGLLTVFP